MEGGNMSAIELVTFNATSWSNGSDVWTSLNDTSGDLTPRVPSTSVTKMFPPWVSTLAFVCAVVFSIVGVIGNLLTIFALWKSMKLRVQSTTYFIISLSISDLIFCAFNLPITAARYYSQAWRLGNTMCKLFPFMFYGNVASSLFNLVGITINRYILVSHAGKYNAIYRTPFILMMVACVWIFSFVMLLPPLLGIWGEFGLDMRSFSCTILSKNGTSPKAFLMAFGIALPFVIMIVCYSLIYVKICRSRQALDSHKKTSKPRAHSSNISRSNSAHLSNSSKNSRNGQIRAPRSSSVNGRVRGVSNDQRRATKPSSIKDRVRGVPANLSRSLRNTNIKGHVKVATGNLSRSMRNISQTCLSAAKFVRTNIAPRRMIQLKKRRKDDIKLTSMILKIVGMFIVCFGPLLFFNILDNDIQRFDPSWHAGASILAWLAAVANPFIYAFSNSQYRNAYKNVVRMSKLYARVYEWKQKRADKRAARARPRRVAPSSTSRDANTAITSGETNTAITSGDANTAITSGEVNSVVPSVRYTTANQQVHVTAQD